MNKQEIQKLLIEKKKRDSLKGYSQDFTKFAEEQIQIITKDAAQGFVPFTFNRCQQIITDVLSKQIEETGKVRAIILKARQQGISTYCSGRVFWKSYFTAYARSVVMAHDSATSDALFAMSKNLIRNMSGSLSPTEIRSNAKEIIINSPWMPDKDATANGSQGEFYRLWKGAVAGENEYVPIFLPWYITDEYRRSAPEGMELTIEEEIIEEKYGLDNDQLYWRRLKIAEGGELKFKQEYPATADEAFIVSGSNVFNVERLDSLVPQPHQRRSEWDPHSKMFDEHREGTLYIYDFPKWEEPYVIGADVSLGVGQDYSACVVMNKDREVVAVYRNNRIDPSMWGELLFYLGRYYNNALLAVESNSMGIATLQRLESMDYINLYRQTKIANVSNEEGTRLGFRTTSATKPAIIGNLKNLIENEDLLIPSPIMIQELKDYISSETGKTGAAPGCYDDTVISLAICAEVLRTHWDKLQTNNVSWKQRTAEWDQDRTKWL